MASPRTRPANILTVDRPISRLAREPELRDLRIARSRVTLSFRRSGPGTTGFSLLEQEGDVRMTMSA